MGVLGVIIVVRAIEVGGHDGDIVGTVLAIQELAILETGDLGEGVGLVGLLEFAGEQATLGHGLWSHAGVDAAGAQELEFLAAVLPCSVYDVHLQNHVVIHEIGKGGLVSDDAAYLGSSEEHVLGALLGEEGLNGILAGEVKFLVGAGDNIGIALALELANYRATHHAPVACHIYS